MMANKNSKIFNKYPVYKKQNKMLINFPCKKVIINESNSILLLKENSNQNFSSQFLLRHKSIDQIEQSESKNIKNLKMLLNFEEQFNDPDLCKICWKNSLGENNSIKIHHEHIFCKDCIQNYLMVLIKNGHCKFLCPAYKCIYIISNESIFKNNLGDDLLNLITKNRKRSEFNTYLKFQGYKECVFPNCDQYAKLSFKMINTYKCLKGHQFCKTCLKMCPTPQFCKDYVKI
jgi:hypothetical protein